MDSAILAAFGSVVGAGRVVSMGAGVAALLVGAIGVGEPVGVDDGDCVESLVVVVVNGAAVAGGATKPRAVIAMASEAKAAEIRLR